jgi:hypothetical protein
MPVETHHHLPIDVNLKKFAHLIKYNNAPQEIVFGPGGLPTALYTGGCSLSFQVQLLSRFFDRVNFPGSSDSWIL